jgi:two-component system, chemotaxis family, CheB/CheR fusion protein
MAKSPPRKPSKAILETSSASSAQNRAQAAPDAEHDRRAQPVYDEEPPRLAFPVVGIGASAGGLEAAIEFFQNMRADSGMAFVLVQHLPPDRETLITEILSKKTTMPVLHVDDGLELQPNHVYCIRPGRTLLLQDGRFRLGEPLVKPMRNRPIDDFFKSLAEEQRERGIAIILSGMGSNGSAGAQAIKAVGGLCVAQDPETAAFPSMPRHLVDAGYADFILKPADMPEMLIGYAEHPYAREEGNDLVARALRREQQYIREILAVMRTRTRHDFSGYKKPTLLRRIQRRMGLARLTHLSDYVRLLRQTPGEVVALTDDLLIHVTGFFRDPEAWESLRELVIAPLIAGRDAGSTIRAWVTACASGEEAYTLAMLLIEESDRLGKPLDIKIFATDTADRTLQNARHGVYPGGIEAEIMPERLERFFQREDAVYRVRQELRERVIFAPQNVLRDPPFSRLDIVTCRNLLIYLEPELQQRVLSLLHFGLREGGALFLGTSETAAGNDGLFETIEKKARIFRRVGPTRHGGVEFPIPQIAAARAEVKLGETRPVPPRPTLAQLTHRALLDHHTPAAVTIDREFRILYYHGNTAPYFAQPPGEPTRELLTVVRDTLRGGVRTALHRAIGHNAATQETGWIEDPDGKREQVAIRVSAIHPKSDLDCFIVSFQRFEAWAAEPVELPGRGQENADDLRRVRDELQSTVEELQTSNEELKAAHEEVVSTNEEIQSTNEELETSREEMQSLNEELSTVNSQLQAKVEEYQAVSSDLASLLTSTDLAVLFLDTRFRIRRFTPQVSDLIDVISSDIGRPLSDLAQKFDDPDLLRDAAQVLERLVPSEHEVSVAGGRWFLRRITPYRTAENRIDGIVIAFVETTARRRAEQALRRSEEQFRRAIEEAPIPVLLLAEDGEVLQLSSAWTRLTGHVIREVPTLEAWLHFVDAESVPTLRAGLQAVFSRPDARIDADLAIRTPNGLRHWTLSASSPGVLPDGRRMCVGMAVDITDRKRAELELLASKEAVEAASAMKDQFLANISHELRTPLSVILMWSKLLAGDEMAEADRKDAVDAIARSADAQRRLIEDLLDTTRIASGKLRVMLKPVPLAQVVSAAADAIRPLAQVRNQKLTVAVADGPGHVLGDSVRLEQVVWILLHNAVKFSPSGGEIRLTLERQSDLLVLTVQDDGPGIAADFLPRLFQPFVQAGDDKGSRARSGLGLGLSIAKSLVQMHGGTIQAVSSGSDHGGATFVVRIPVHTVSQDRSTTNGKDNGRVLEGVVTFLIEDNDDARRAIRRALERAGARVVAFESAEEALVAFREAAPSLVVSDIGLPGASGLELIEQIRAIEKQENLASVRALALTARVTGTDQAAARASGFDAFVAKPVEPESLIDAACSILALQTP